MSEYTLIGFLGYIFAFCFFFIASLFNVINAFGQYKIGKSNGFSYKYKINDWFLDTPIKALFTSIIIAIVGFYISLTYLIPIMIKYWKYLG